LSNQLPAHLQAYQSRDLGTTALANLGSSMPPHVSIGNNRFTLIDAGNNEIPVPTFDPKLGPYLDACIIDVADVMSRIYFAGVYDPGAEGTRPDCFSDNGVGPSVSASTPQAPTCAACPRSEWTKVNANGKKVPWCSMKYKVALLVPGFDAVFLLAVPPASHGPLREYLATCKGNSAHMQNLITRISFVSQGVLQFHPLTWIDAAVASLRERAYVEKKTDSLVGRLDVARSPASIAGPVQTASPTQIPTETQFGQGQHQAAQQSFPQTSTAPVGHQPTQVQQWAQQNPAQQQWPQQGAAQQVQQPVPFGDPSPGQHPAQNAGWPGPTNQPALTAAMTSPSEQPTTGRRKRRTQAEIAAANGGGQPAGAQQAPFPHPGQQTVPFAQTAPAGAQTVTGAAFATGPATAPPTQLEFGIGQGADAGANPEIKGMLDNFFTGGPA
jgi:hypothetical protein